MNPVIMDSPARDVLAEVSARPTVPVTAVIVSYSSSPVIGDCLAALQPAMRDGLLHVVVVDNASPDRTADLVARDHPWVELVRSPENLGYGRGCNRGFDQVRSPYVIFMNADVFIEAQAIRALVKFMDEHEGAGMAAPATQLGKGDPRVQFVGRTTTPWALMADAAGLAAGRSMERLVYPGQEAFKTDWLCGAVMFARSEAIRRIGGFDPRFFLYFEETDLCRRLRADGWELWAVGDATATHLLGQSARSVDKSLVRGACLSDHFYRSRYYFVSKHYGRLAAATTETWELVAKGSRDVVRAIFQRPAQHELRDRLKAPVYRWPERLT
jgi:N-acetylglucosaminyl-diphospho-decaprenol L-rhamnosyltransferase